MFIAEPATHLVRLHSYSHRRLVRISPTDLMRVDGGREVRTVRLVFLGRDANLTSLKLFEGDIESRKSQLRVGLVYDIFGLRIKAGKAERLLTLPAGARIRCVRGSECVFSAYF